MFKFDPGKNLLGEYGPLDGTMEFYGRINAIIKNTDFVLDLGAGRGSWFFDDNCSYRRNIRNIKDKVKFLVGVDMDKAIFVSIFYFFFSFIFLILLISTIYNNFF